MPAVLSDYGGFAYGRVRVGKATLDNNVETFRCLDCDAVRFVTQRELVRAARPHCLKCGGPLEQTRAQQTRKKRAGYRKKVREEIFLQRAGYRKKVREEIFACRNCGQTTASCKGLAFHLKDRSECRDKYPTHCHKGSTVLVGSVFPYLEIGGYNCYATTTSGKIIVLDTYPGMTDADKFCAFVNAQE